MKSDLDVSIDEVSAAFLGVDDDQLWFGDDFQRAWSNVVKSVKTDKRKLYLVTDFDHTLTTFDSKQCHDIVALHDEYPKEFHADFLEICAMAFSDSNFHKWWRMAHDLIVDRSGLTEEMFHRGIQSSNIQLRPGTVNLIAYCRDSDIPTVITSAGITNVIAAVLESHGVSSVHNENFHIDANYMEFHSENGSLLNIFPEVPVHSSAKKFVHTRAAHMFTSIDGIKINDNLVSESSINISIVKDDSELNISKLSEISVNENEDIKTVFECADNVLLKSDIDSIQKNGATAILLGDNEGDFEALSELSEINEAYLFKIGFALNQEKAQKLISKKCCDIILIGENHGVENVLKLLKTLVSHRNPVKSDSLIVKNEKLIM